MQQYIFFLSYILTYMFRWFHSTIVSVLDFKEYNKLQRVHPSKVHFLKCVM
jgi:hypothetical protein